MRPDNYTNRSRGWPQCRHVMWHRTSCSAIRNRDGRNVDFTVAIVAAIAFVSFAFVVVGLLVPAAAPAGGVATAAQTTAIVIFAIIGVIVIIIFTDPQVACRSRCHRTNPTVSPLIGV